MAIFGLLIIFLQGGIVVHLLARETSLLLKAGFAFPVGLGINAFLMFGMELLHIPLYKTGLLLPVEFALVVAAGQYIFQRHRTGIRFLEQLRGLRHNFRGLLRGFHPAWLLLVGCMIFVVYGVLEQALFWPVFIYDSINGFDFVAKAIVEEGTLNSTLFNADMPLYSLRSLYPPLVSLNFAFVYLLGFSSSHIVVALFYASMAVSFYALLVVYTTHFSAALFTLLLIITPEYASFSALSSSNPVCAFYASLGLLCLYIGYDRDRRAYANLGMLLILFSLWTRPEAVVFAAVAGGMVLWTGIRKREALPVVVFGVACIAVFGAWQLYLRFVLPVEEAQPLMLNLHFDAGKLGRMMGKIRTVTFNARYYGIGVYLFLAVLLLNVWRLIRQKDRLVLLLMLFGGWALYIFVFYQIDTDFQQGSTNWIEDAYRRGLFCFFPLMFFYVATSAMSIQGFRKYLNP